MLYVLYFITKGPTQSEKPKRHYQTSLQLACKAQKEGILHND